MTRVTLNPRSEMTCAYCGESKPWPGDFVNSYLAQCLKCAQEQEEADRILGRRFAIFMLAVPVVIVLAFVAVIAFA